MESENGFQIVISKLTQYLSIPVDAASMILQHGRNLLAVHVWISLNRICVALRHHARVLHDCLVLGQSWSTFRQMNRTRI